MIRPLDGGAYYEHRGDATPARVNFAKRVADTELP